MTKPRSFAPIIAAVLLLLPALYVGSYFVLVVPEGCQTQVEPGRFRLSNYRVDVSGRWGSLMRRLYWPVEQIDRKVRPKAWKEGSINQMIKEMDEFAVRQRRNFNP